MVQFDKEVNMRVGTQFHGLFGVGKLTKMLGPKKLRYLHQIIALKLQHA